MQVSAQLALGQADDRKVLPADSLEYRLTHQARTWDETRPYPQINARTTKPKRDASAMKARRKAQKAARKKQRK